jgi:hypothetical protein
MSPELRELVAMEWIAEADGVFPSGGLKGLGLAESGQDFCP